MQGPATFYTWGLSPGVRLRLFGPRFKNRCPKQPKAPFFLKRGLMMKVQPRFEDGALGPRNEAAF